MRHKAAFVSRYTQDGWLIKGPGLPESGAVSVGIRELQAAYQEGLKWAEAVARADAESGRRDFARTGKEVYRQMSDTALFIADMCRDECHNLETEIGRK